MAGEVFLKPTRSHHLQLSPVPRGREGRDLRVLFDEALDAIHYAGSCQRVGRCMRLAVREGLRWLGGIVLGSTFPNIHDRDTALGLKRHVAGATTRGLRSAWARENHAYWDDLQTIVNHARTFVFPEYQGRGIGIEAHRLLLRQGMRHWRARYRGTVRALDTLCDSEDSGLFLRNGWLYVGKTSGFGSDPSRNFVEPPSDDRSLKNNVALRKTGRQWEVWVRLLNRHVMPASS
jgi:GNAT superfamily N-acetyltransferase